jgi:formylglycine-generating enzyme required for sulfatase activity
MSSARNAILVLIPCLSGLFTLFGLSILAAKALHEEKKTTAGDEPTIGEVRKFEITKDVFMEFCWLPPGVAQLGSSKEEHDYITKTYLKGDRPDYHQFDFETESKRGKFKTMGFWLGKYTVTQAEWKAVMGENPSHFDGIKDNKAKGLDTRRFPVERVSWDECQKFLEKLNKQPDLGKVFGSVAKFVLPHEDQWEYAARGGKGNKQPFYWGNELNGTQANCDGNCPFGTATKGQYLNRPCSVDFTNDGKYEKHPWGLFHMNGNVWQWCENLHEQKKYRVLRGGSWNDEAWLCRVASRDCLQQVGRNVIYGFRVCVSLEK